ncbi:VOC family protein [Kitasatospora aureofaciens]|uniref:VOC family protein n=1 Tax=Kitasatospora aureofaciens TaxID=1894 RepID=UPI001C469021|nr:VOC family protein [Kitasatospora aureofaciens]MBV6701768.1 VOC family protein [Kitasatospora aureofaciens]
MSGTTLLRTLKTGHVGLNVTDLDRSIDFYRAVLGVQVVHEGTDPERRYALMGRDGRLVVTLWQQSAGTFATATPGLHHLSFEVESLDEVRATEHLLRELGAGFAYDGVVPHGEGSASGGLFFTDPDGIRLEIYTRTGVAETGATAPTSDAPTCGFF